MGIDMNKFKKKNLIFFIKINVFYQNLYFVFESNDLTRHQWMIHLYCVDFCMTFVQNQLQFSQRAENLRKNIDNK